MSKAFGIWKSPVFFFHENDVKVAARIMKSIGWREKSFSIHRENTERDSVFYTNDKNFRKFTKASK
jgi:hypothetical protein